jgi:UDP-N-acetylglucosamine 2-epimerase
MTTAIIVGTKPETMKIAPFKQEFQERNADFDLIHTGRQFAYETSMHFVEGLKFLDPRCYSLKLG